jgi:hypothetical protein
VLELKDVSRRYGDTVMGKPVRLKEAWRLARG